MFLGKFLEMGEYDKHFYGTSLDRLVSHIFSSHDDDCHSVLEVKKI